MTDEIVPENFDLDEARRAKSVTPDHKRKRCPECDSLKIHRRVVRGRQTQQGNIKYHCRNCSTHFNKPIQGKYGKNNP